MNKRGVKGKVREALSTFACFLIGAQLEAGRALALGAAGQVHALVGTAEIGQLLVLAALVHVRARLVVPAGVDCVTVGTRAVRRAVRVDAHVRAAKVVRRALVDI